MLKNKLLTMASGLAVAVTMATAGATPATAQGGVELTPWVGAYVPTSNSVGALDQDIERDVSVAGGARLTFWGTGMLGFEVTGGYAPAKIGDETINETGNTDLLLANGRLMLALSPVSNNVGFYLAGGPALLVRGSNPFDDDRSSTDIGGVVGLGFRFGGEDSRVGFRLDIEDYLYNGDFGGGDDFQNDLVASIGVSFALGGEASE
jgi:outer membrane protein with beta-barrel domain